MNNYEYIKSLNMEEMALTLTGIELKTYEELRQKLAPNIPPLTAVDSVNLYNANYKMLHEKTND